MTIAGWQRLHGSLLIALMVAFGPAGCYNCFFDRHDVQGDVEHVRTTSLGLTKRVYLVFPAIALSESGEHEFTWSGAASDHMFFVLNFASADVSSGTSVSIPDDVRAQLAVLDPHISIEILDSERRTLAAYAGPLSTGWRAMGAESFRAPPGELYLRFNPTRAPYELRIRVHVDGAAGPPIRFVPVLESDTPVTM